MTRPQATAQGIVTALDDASGRRIARVLAAPAAPCTRCAEGRGCGADLFRWGRRHNEFGVALPPGLDVAVGDTVQLAVPERLVLRVALLAFGVPLAAAAIGAAMAAVSGAGDSGTVLAAVLTLLAGTAFARWRLAVTGIGTIEPQVSA